MSSSNEMVENWRNMEKVPRYSTWVSRNPPATTLLFTGPTGGDVSAASTAFTVSRPSGKVLTEPVVVTPADSGTGDAGVFTPTSLFLSNEQTSGTFTYTPGSTGAKVVSVTNSGSLTNPSSITYTSV